LWFGLAGSAIYASRRKGSRRLSEDFGLRIELADVPVGLVAGIAAQLILIPGLALLLSPLLGKPEVSGPVEDLLDSAKGFALVGLFLFVVVGAPLVEELFFRGLLFRSLRRRLRPAYAIGIAGVLFGLAHPQDLPVKALVLVMVSLAAFGALLAYLAHRYGRLGPCIVAHAAFNAWTLTILLRK
jgi:membrane protease YdiL (CAAX protease family)